MINTNSDITFISRHHGTSYADVPMPPVMLNFVFFQLTKLEITFLACLRRDPLNRSIITIICQVRAIGRNAAN